MIRAYYNEFEPYAAAWLRNLIAAGLIAPGDVDERSITEVTADDLRPYRQVHLFAGIGGWSYAARLAGIPDDADLWTGSCPCQPFSGAGKAEALGDERHLWPAFHRLLAEYRPPIVAGEQVASAAGRAWLAGVRVDLEGLGYAVGAADLCAASAGAPHIRQRLFWVADAGRERDGDTRPGADFRAASGMQGAPSERERVRPEPRQRGATERLAEPGRRQPGRANSRSCEGITSDGPGPSNQLRGSGDPSSGLGHADHARSQRNRSELPQGANRPTAGTVSSESSILGSAGRMADSTSQREQREQREQRDNIGPEGAHRPGADQPDGNGRVVTPWNDALWLPCRDGKARRIESGLEPLAHGVPARVGQLRAYGNAIVPQVAAEFLRAYLTCRP